MPIRKNLSANLRRLVSSHASVAAVCRGLPMNRSQFERYLQGKSVPNQATAKLICDYFRVGEDELYRAPPVPETAPPALMPIHQTLYENMVRGPAPAIAGGTYFTYFAVPDRPDLVMRSVTFVRREAELVTFRRVTRWAEGHRQGGARALGWHYGVAISRLNWIYFAGINRRQTGEPSIMAVQWAPFSEPVLVGNAYVLTQAGPACVKVIMRQEVGRISLRQAMRMSGVVSLDDPHLDQLVASLVREG
ncbi:transcriptional regulator [Mesorhizobium erdmanii]|uniref:XRE family transcriptional regulator n=1 Tax=Mesorhizobium erdmanii TaxID=1777866 RepID=A0A6M7UJZ9_9HYPH|nr:MULTISPECIES: transcriptional regulator [Mesorhizobium]OBQ73341.1 transcriptional regulator [Mesorhizobium loti]QKC76463.1 XRE family transcriptional regulator [Mesorhizobium erdmanii]